MDNKEIMMGALKNAKAVVSKHENRFKKTIYDYFWQSGIAEE